MLTSEADHPIHGPRPQEGAFGYKSAPKKGGEAFRHLYRHREAAHGLRDVETGPVGADPFEAVGELHHLAIRQGRSRLEPGAQEPGRALGHRRKVVIRQPDRLVEEYRIRGIRVTDRLQNLRRPSVVLPESRDQGPWMGQGVTSTPRQKATWPSIFLAIALASG